MKISRLVSSFVLTSSIATALPIGYAIPPFAVGRQFFLNGKLQRLAGINAWWLGHLYSDTDVEAATSQIAASGLQVVRVWGFGNANTPTSNPYQVYYQLIESNGTSINYGPNGIARLDSAIKYAEKYGLKFVLPMLNNWDDLGGISTYTTAFGGNATSFFTDKTSQKAYRGWIKFVVNRYKSSPAIFAWELCNEPRCHGCNTDIIYNWAKETSEYIKSLDPLHMVTLGDEGWFDGTYSDGTYAYSGLEGIDFVKNLGIKTLDYAVAHLYPSYWGYNSSWGNTWIQQHAAAGKKAKKPVVLEEYGWSVSGEAVPVQLQWQATARSAGIAIDQKWQFGTVLPSGANPFDGFAVYYNTTAGSDYSNLVLKNVKTWAKTPILL